MIFTLGETKRLGMRKVHPPGAGGAGRETQEKLVYFSLGKPLAEHIKGVFSDQKGIWIISKGNLFYPLDLEGVGHSEDDILALTGIGPFAL